MISFRVSGIPAPQGSKRHVGNGVMVESSKAVGPWREAVRSEAQRALSGTPGLPKGVPVMVTLVFALGRPDGHYGTGRNAGQLRPGAPHFPVGRPDIDKLERAVLDGLTAAGVWHDDGQVVSVVKSKIYANEHIPPGAVIGVEACDGE